MSNLESSQSHFILNLEDSFRAHALKKLNDFKNGDNVYCKICHTKSSLFDVIDFSKACERRFPVNGPTGIPIYYWRCSRCDFIFTSFFDDLTPEQWVGIVYNEQYYLEVDPEYKVKRPTSNARQVDQLLRSSKRSIIGLDYGGGNGLTSDLLRNKGYHFDCYDPYGVSRVDPGRLGHYNFCSVFEVAEHSTDPQSLLSEILRFCSPGKLAILISTYTHDGVVDYERRLGWWYAAPRNGHISLYSRKSLVELASQHGLNCLSFSARTHLLTRGWKPHESWFRLVVANILTRLGFG